MDYSVAYSGLFLAPIELLSKNRSLYKFVQGKLVFNCGGNYGDLVEKLGNPQVDL